MTENQSNSNNKIALITGGAKRIGKAIAMELHSRNIDIIIHCNRSIDDAKQLKGQLNNIRPNSADILVADLSDKETSSQLIKHIEIKYRKLDYLVNNASVYYPTPIAELKKEELDEILLINLYQPINLAKHVYPLLKKNKGSIVNIIDIYAQTGLTEHSAYVASKSALLEATKILALELAPEVRVNAVSPGAILWPESGLDSNNKSHQTIIEKTALKRRGQAQDISKTVAFLLTQANYSTGSMINVDGGRRLYI